MLRVTTWTKRLVVASIMYHACLFVHQTASIFDNAGVKLRKYSPVSWAVTSEGSVYEIHAYASPSQHKALCHYEANL